MNLFAGNCPSKWILILILTVCVIIHIRHIIYTVLHSKWNVVTLSIQKGRGKRGTMEGGKLFQMKEENENISFNSYNANIKTTHPFSLTFSSNFLSFDSYFFVFVFRTTNWTISRVAFVSISRSRHWELLCKAAVPQDITKIFTIIFRNLS